MNKIIMIIGLFLLPCGAWSQRYMFADDGAMASSALKIDTILRVNFRSTGSVIFENIGRPGFDSALVDDLIPQAVQNKINGNDYFLLANFTSGSLILPRLNSYLVAEEIAVFSDGSPRPVSYFYLPACGVGVEYSNIVLQPFDVALIRNDAATVSGSDGRSTRCKTRLLTADNITLSSTSYERTISHRQFFITSELSFPNQRLQSSLAFNPE
jgi:hypothetical protein